MPHILDKVDELLKKLKALQPLKPELQNKLDKKFRLEFNYNSNHLEGNTLTYSETELLLIFDDTKGGHTLREYEEMKAHDVAYQLVEEWAIDSERPLSEQYIKNLNEIILVRPFWKEAITTDGQPTRRLIEIGNYKNHPNSVRLQNGEIFEYTSVADTPIEMKELLDWYKGEEKAIHPVTLAAMLHYKFVRIHPFDDGNGRVSRLLMNYVLLRNNFPPIIIKSDDKQNYLNALHQADVGDFKPFINYIAEQVAWSLELSIKGAKGESLDEPGDLEKKLSVLKKKLNQDKEVNIKYNSEVFDTICYVFIEKLMLIWCDIQSKFDSLFFSSSFQINSNETTIQGPLSSQDMQSKLNTFLSDLSYHGYTPTYLKFSSSFQRLKSAKSKNNFDGGFFKFNFFDNAFEITFSGSEKSINKLYDEELTKEEMQIIVDSIGNWFYTQIEKAIENESKL